jgi:hypothetical protein
MSLPIRCGGLQPWWAGWRDTMPQQSVNVEPAYIYYFFRGKARMEEDGY